jgi:hypothetical protein
MKYLRGLLPIKRYWFDKDNGIVYYSHDDYPNQSYVRSESYDELKEKYQELKQQGAASSVAKELHMKISELEYEIKLRNMADEWNKRTVHFGIFSQLKVYGEIDYKYCWVCYISHRKMFKLPIPNSIFEKMLNHPNRDTAFLECISMVQKTVRTL